jgi:hypothetical protein
MARIPVDRYHAAARRKIVAGLIAYNAKQAGKSPYKALTITLRESRRVDMLGTSFERRCDVIEQQAQGAT